MLVVTVVHDPDDARIRHRQIPALQAAGHDVIYAAPFTAFDRQAPPGVRPVDLPRAAGRRRLGAVRAARREIRRLREVVDVVLLHDPDLLLAVVGQRSGPAVVWDVHEDTAAALGMRAWVPGPLRGVFAGLVRLAEGWAERHLVLLLAERAYQARFRCDHAVVPNSVLVPEHAPAAPDDRRIVYLGKVTRARGCQEMIEVARLLRGTRVQIIGSADPDSAALLEAAVNEGVLDWEGFVPNDVAVQMLDGALAGLSLLHDQPNYRHSEPTKLMEYMAHGVPVITTPNAASRELVERADCGIVVPFADPNAVARAVASLARDRHERERLGANGYGYASRLLNWLRDAEAFVSYLQEAADRSR
ncbi:glycosyltransferase [Pseudactinotalea sp.]|uniref:glycosyltransferase n=1 Tax=Pseudactinotalea sp. TaxID=1926260 RepID=UPI003B3ABF20